MDRLLSTVEFEDLKLAALADCEALDVAKRLAEIELAPDTVAVAIGYEQEKRLCRYGAAIRKALTNRVDELKPQKAAIDETLALAESILDQTPYSSDETSMTERPVLPEDLLQKLETGFINRDTFVASAVAYGYSESLAARTFYKHQRDDSSSFPNVNLERLMDDVMGEIDSDGLHPLESRIHGYGPVMLEVTFAVCDAYLTASDTVEASRAQD